MQSPRVGRALSLAIVSLGLTIASVGAGIAVLPAPPAQGAGPGAPASKPSVSASYSYVAETTAAAKKQGAVNAGGLTWQCHGSRCTITGPWPAPGVGSCRALAEQVGALRSYGHAGRQLSGSELQQCNAGVTAFAARSVTPLPIAPTAVPGVAGAPALQKGPDVSLRALGLDQPRIEGYSAASVVPGQTLNVFGGNLGKAGSAHRVRLGGMGTNRDIAPSRVRSDELVIEIPKGVRPGRYYVGIADAASGRWLSNIDQMLEVVEAVRRVELRLEVEVGCEYDVRFAAPNVELRFAPAMPGARPISVALGRTAERSAPNGGRIFEYRGHLDLRVGSHRVAGSSGRFDVDFWDYINGNAEPRPGGGVYVARTNWDDCHVRRRVTSRGGPLPGPMRKALDVHASDRDARLTIVPETRELRLAGYLLTSGLGSLPPPTPVCPAGGCE